jgi:hypothetical protein
MTRQCLTSARPGVIDPHSTSARPALDLARLQGRFAAETRRRRGDDAAPEAPESGSLSRRRAEISCRCCHHNSIDKRESTSVMNRNGCLALPSMKIEKEAWFQSQTQNQSSNQSSKFANTKSVLKTICEALHSAPPNPRYLVSVPADAMMRRRRARGAGVRVARGAGPTGPRLTAEAGRPLLPPASARTRSHRMSSHSRKGWVAGGGSIPRPQIRGKVSNSSPSPPQDQNLSGPASPALPSTCT